MWAIDGAFATLARKARPRPRIKMIVAALPVFRREARYFQFAHRPLGASQFWRMQLDAISMPVRTPLSAISTETAMRGSVCPYLSCYVRREIAIPEYAGGALGRPP